MLKPEATQGNAPASPGELWAAPAVDMEAERRAQFAAEEAQKQQMFLSDEARKASFGDDVRQQEAARFAAQQAEERAQLAAKQANATQFEVRQKQEQAQFVQKHNEAIMSVDTNRNGKSDYVEAQEAERARQAQLATALVVGVAATAAFAEAGAPRGGYTAFDSNVMNPASPIAMAAPSAPPAATREEAPAMGAAQSNNPVMNPANPIQVGAGFAGTMAATELAATAAPALAPLGLVAAAFGMAKEPRGGFMSFDSNPAPAARPEPTPIAAAPMAAEPAMAAPRRVSTPSFAPAFPPPAPKFKARGGSDE